MNNVELKYEFVQMEGYGLGQLSKTEVIVIVQCVRC